MLKTLTETIREDLAAIMKGCGCFPWESCEHSNRPVSMREIARRSGVPVSTVSRFMAAKTVESDAVDKLAAVTKHIGEPRA
jgi:DNA-directed RNA polymerase specialized sigma54-like protein